MWLSQGSGFLGTNGEPQQIEVTLYKMIEIMKFKNLLQTTETAIQTFQGVMCLVYVELTTVFKDLQ